MVTVYLLGAELFQAQLFLDVSLVGFVHQRTMRQVKLTLFAFLRQNMALKSVLSFDFSGTGQLEPLLGTGFRFLFRHFS